MSDADEISFHDAWGLAKDRTDYDKSCWNALWSTYTKSDARYTFAKWYGIAYGRVLR